MGSVLIAYSGGADSSLLLKVAGDVLGEKVLAVTALSETYPEEEARFARKLAKKLKVRHLLIKTREIKERNFRSNPVNRCYYCKKELFSKLTKMAAGNKINYVIDGTNSDDKYDFRPGSLVRKEFKVRSPLKEAGLGKGHIRLLSRRFNLCSWDKPALACLASRIPYGTAITSKTLKKIDQAEIFLRNMGFKQVRLRHYNGLCRIEVPQNEIPALVRQRNLVVEKFKKLGYNYVTVDLQGYRTGSMNEIFKKDRK